MKSVSSNLKSQWPRHLLRPRLCGLYVITEETVISTARLAARDEYNGQISRHEQIARAAIAGGASVLQLRDKSTPLPELFEIALRLRDVTRRARVLFFINDRPDLALACDADGVHLGPDDLPLRAARNVLGENRLIGVSCGNVEEARRAFEGGADYIGAGAIFATTTKQDAGAPIGLDNLRAICNSTPLPVAAIAGIDASNIYQIAEYGARMACVVSAVTRNADSFESYNFSSEEQMTAATRNLVERFTSRRQ